MGGVLSYSSNIQSLSVQRYLARSTFDLNRSLNRLSSGQRINTASDDAAGLAISSSLEAASRIYGQGIRNINDGLSLLNIAQGGLTQLSDVTMRLKELATQASNGSFSTVQRRSLTEEAEQLTSEFNRIVASTTFNGKKLLDGLSRSFRIQAGTGIDGGIGLGVGNELVRKSGTSGFTSVDNDAGTAGDYAVADLNGDGNLDMIVADALTTRPALYLGAGDGTFAFSASIGAAGSSNGVAIAAGDIDGDGDADFVYTNSTEVKIFRNDGGLNFTNSQTINKSSIGELKIADVTGDSIADIIAIPTSGAAVSIYANLGNGSFNTTAITVNATGNNVSNVAVGDFDGDGKNDLVVGSTGGTPSSAVYLNNGSGSFTLASTFGAGGRVAFGDFDADGYLDVVRVNGGSVVTYKGNGNGTFQSGVTYTASGTGATKVQVGDINGDGRADIVASTATNSAISIFLGNSDGTFLLSNTFSTSASGSNGELQLADTNNDGVQDILQIIGGHGIVSYTASTTDVTSIQYFNLSSQQSARQALSDIDSILERVQKELANIGSSQSRLGYALNVTGDTILNYEASKSRILDIDVASEASELTRNQILQNTATALLAQANIIPQIALNILQSA